MSLSPLGEEAWAEEAARARLYRVLSQVLKARDLDLNWEGPSGGANLIRNLCQVAFMGLAPSLAGALPLLAGRLSNAVLFCSDLALPEVLAAGILPTAAVLLSPAAGRLFFPGPPMAGAPASDRREGRPRRHRVDPSRPARHLLDPPRGRVRSLGRAGRGLHPPAPRPEPPGRGGATGRGEPSGALVGVDLIDARGHLTLPGTDGSPVQTNLEQASTASGLGLVLARAGGHALNTSWLGLGLPGTRFTELDRLMRELGAPGQPLRVAALD